MATRNESKDKGKNGAAEESAEKVKSAKAKPLRKITLAIVCGKVKGNAELMKEIISADGQAIPLMDVIGIATKAKPGETDKGEFVRFVGQFRAVNLKTGEVYAAPACILPNFLAEEIHGAMTVNENVQNAQFAFRIGVFYSPESLTQYQYTADPLIAPAEADALMLLEKQAREGAKLLENRA